MAGLLLEDLRNRRVVRVAVRYILIATGLLLALAVARAGLGLPEWTMRMAAGIGFFGMPFVLVLVWALDDTGPEQHRGGRRRSVVAGPGGPTTRTGRIP